MKRFLWLACKCIGLVLCLAACAMNGSTPSQQPPGDNCGNYTTAGQHQVVVYITGHAPCSDGPIQAVIQAISANIPPNQSDLPNGWTCSTDTNPGQGQPLVTCNSATLLLSPITKAASN